MARTFVSTSGSHISRAECGADGDWVTEVVLDGTDVCCLAADPHHPDTVYAGTRGSGVLRSDDRGKTWRPSGITGQIVKAIAVSPARQGLIFAGTKPPALFVSDDGGQTWSECESLRRMRRWFWFTPAEPGPPYVQAIAPSPDDPDLLLAGIEFGAVLRSMDGGRTWSAHLKWADRDCHAMTFHTSDGNWVYEAGGTAAAYSRDRGATWQQPDPLTYLGYIRLALARGVRPSKGGLDRRYCFAVGADSARPDIWFVAASPGPFKAHVIGKAEAYIYRKSGDASWQKLGGGLPQPLPNMPYALLPDRAVPGRLYAGLSNGDVWQTADYGDHWTRLPFNLGPIHTSMVVL